MTRPAPAPTVPSDATPIDAPVEAKPADAAPVDLAAATEGAPPLAVAMAPVRAALLVAARRDAGALLAQAGAAAVRTTEEAGTHAARISAEAHAAGVADATAVGNADRARLGRHTRSIVLQAHRDEYDSLRAAARAAVGALRADPGYPGARLRMVEIIQTVIGPDAELSEGEGGGVVGAGAGRRVDLSLTGFADRAAETVAARWLDLREGGQR